MKLPAVCLAAAFTGGVALGLFSSVHIWSDSSLAIRLLAIATFCLLAISLYALCRGFILFAGGISLIVWLSLGTLSALLASQPAPANQVLNLVSAARLDISSPLRWHGHLRDEPADAPWGVSYDVALDSVEFNGAMIPAIGGIRLSYSAHGEDSQLPLLHTGDGISFLAQGHLPQVFRSEGAFDRRTYLQRQGVDLVASLRASSLLQKESSASFSAKNMFARARQHLRNELNTIFPNSPDVAGVLRAMLLGDRSFIDREESNSFQKTGVFHVLVVAGLHVGAIAVFLYWLGRKFRLSIGLTTFFLLFALTMYVSIIEQRPPVLRAALMAFVLLIAGYFFRRMELLNSAAIAALVMLIANPRELGDSSFQLSFLSIGCIGGIAVPWMDIHVEPYVRALRGWRDVTRDAAHEARIIQFRIDFRSVAGWLTYRATGSRARLLGDAFALFIRASLRIWELIFLTLVLQIGMSPLMALNFHRVALIGALGNLIAVPLTGMLVPFGFVILLFASISTTVATWLAAPLRWLTEFLIQTVTWFSNMPHSNYRVAGPPVWLIILFFVLLTLLAAMLRSHVNSLRRWTPLVAATLFVTTVFVATHPFAPRLAKGKLELSVLDVGQGDSLFLASPSGHTMLIDAGGPPPQFGSQSQQHASDPGEESVSPFLWSRGIKKIDIVALTHAHQDHLGGIPAILENFQIGALWISREVQAPALKKIESIAKRRNIPILHESSGQNFNWDGVEGRFFWPEHDSGDPEETAQNNDSLVLRMQFRNRSFLLPGDAESQAEYEMLSKNGPASLQADVLKVGHHGSKSSTTPGFLAAIHPQWAIISAGEGNPYGHPSPALLQRLEQANARILRTDRDGAIHILTDGDHIDISCFVDCGQIASGQNSAAAQSPDSK